MCPCKCVYDIVFCVCVCLCVSMGVCARVAALLPPHPLSPVQYSQYLYRNWGNLPYSPAAGDYLIDGILRLALPSYQDSSYFHDETGFQAPTPYGDAVDLLLSDAPLWLLERYDTVVMPAAISHDGAYVGSVLSQYMSRGGHLIASAAVADSVAPVRDLCQACCV